MSILTPRLRGLAGALIAGAMIYGASALAREEAVLVPPPSQDETVDAATTTETIVLAGGCFWGVQGVFQHVKGVTRAESGYAGGDAGPTDYETVSTGTTGHAESVEITFDPHVVSLGTLLQVYFSVAHNPTELNRQGPDSGTQYRSAIFTTSEAQGAVAVAYIGEIDAAHVFGDKVVTTVGPLGVFHPAEAYHQDYATLHPESGYIQYNDLPKIAALKALFPQLWLEQPTLINAEGN